MNQVTRPEQIDAILTKLDAQFPYEMGITLETYISNLEANQKVIQTDNTEPENSNPQWSHARSVQRANRRKERAARKRNNYQ